MKIFFTLLFITLGVRSSGQIFSNCSEVFRAQYNAINLQPLKQNVDRAKADSLRKLLTLAFDSCIIGNQMPPFRLVSHSGKVYTNESLKGKVVMFNFWSLNCGPCVMEIPVLNSLTKSYADNDEFILISILRENQQAIDRNPKHMQGRPINYEYVPDSKSLMIILSKHSLNYQPIYL